MNRIKPVLLFIVKAVLIYTFLSLPFEIYDSVYGTFYRACCNKLFAKIDTKGFARFKETKGEYDTQITIGNYAQVSADKKTNLALRHVSSHFTGYIPTALLISLVLATQMGNRRKGYALVIGFILITSFVMFKQWILLLEICRKTEWLQLYNFTSFQHKLIEYLYPKLIPYLGTSWFFVVVIWLLVAIRKDDLPLND